MARFLLVTFLVALMAFASKPSFAEKARAKSSKSSKSSSKVQKSKKSKKSKTTAKKKSKKIKKSKKSQKKKPAKQTDEEIVLRKSNGNRKTVYDDENLGEIYKKERAFFKSDYNSKKDDKPSKVSGPLAAIPTAVIESMVNNLIKAQQDRKPKEPVKAPEPTVAKTPDQLFNVEPTIQGNKRKVESKPKDPAPSAVVLAGLSGKPKSKKTGKEKAPEKPKNVKSEIANELNIVSSSEKDSVRVPSGEKIDRDKLLEKVEKKYTSYFVKMSVKTEVTQALLERTKSYSGKIYLAPGGKFKMEVALPNKHIVLMTGKNIWVVDYPLDETQDKVQILHSKSAKNLKNQPFLNLFQGVGNLKKNFKVESSNGKNDEVIYKLTPKKKGEQIERIELKVDDQSELITSLSFWDSLGNQTQLQLSEQDFESKTPSKIFQFKPPKNSSITYL